jgi:hypothetical protein
MMGKDLTLIHSSFEQWRTLEVMDKALTGSTKSEVGERVRAARWGRYRDGQLEIEFARETY